MTGVQAGSSHVLEIKTNDPVWRWLPQDVLKIVGGDAGAREACQHVVGTYLCVNTPMILLVEMLGQQLFYAISMWTVGYWWGWIRSHIFDGDDMTWYDQWSHPKSQQ